MRAGTRIIDCSTIFAVETLGLFERSVSLDSG